MVAKVDLRAIIGEALGEASILFMSQEVKGTEIVMPTRKLVEIGERAVLRIEQGESSMKNKVLSVRKYKAGYEVREEVVKMPGVPSIKMKSAFNLDGDYIGNSKTAHRLVVLKGIKPEKVTPDASVCSIGYSEKNKLWYGWSHRAIYGFKTGDTVKEGSCCASSGWTDEYLADHPEVDLRLPVGFQAKTLDDARRMAVAFAESVS